jgi:hypothetical protein
MKRVEDLFSTPDKLQSGNHSSFFKFNPPPSYKLPHQIKSSNKFDNRVNFSGVKTNDLESLPYKDKDYSLTEKKEPFVKS